MGGFIPGTLSSVRNAFKSSHDGNSSSSSPFNNEHHHRTNSGTAGLTPEHNPTPQNLIDWDAQAKLELKRARELVDGTGAPAGPNEYITSHIKTAVKLADQAANNEMFGSSLGFETLGTENQAYERRILNVLGVNAVEYQTLMRDAALKHGNEYYRVADDLAQAGKPGAYGYLGEALNSYKAAGTHQAFIDPNHPLSAILEENGTSLDELNQFRQAEGLKEVQRMLASAKTESFAERKDAMAGITGILDNLGLSLDSSAVKEAGIDAKEINELDDAPMQSMWREFTNKFSLKK
jgi:hypothetical protein